MLLSIVCFRPSGSSAFERTHCFRMLSNLYYQGWEEFSIFTIKNNDFKYFNNHMIEYRGQFWSLNKIFFNKY